MTEPAKSSPPPKPAEKAKDAAAAPATPPTPETPAPKGPETPAVKPSGSGTISAGSTSADTPPSPFRLVAFVEDQPADKAAPPDAKAVSSGSGAQTSAPAADTKTEAKPAADKESDAKPADAKAKKPAETPKAAEAKKPADEKKAGEKKNSADEKKVAGEKKPAEEKKSEKKKPEEALSRRLIRRELTMERMQKAFQRLQETMDQYHVRWTRFDVERIRNKAAQSPAEPDLAALAKASGLEFKKTPLLAARQIQHLDIGSSVEVRRQDNGSLLPGQTSFEDFAFESLPAYRPGLAMDIHSDLYLFWKTDERKDRVPSFNDRGVQAEVLKAWKMIDARKKARAAAKDLAVEASKANKSLQELWGKRAGLKVTLAEPFSWLTTGGVPLSNPYVLPRLSEVDGVESAGPQFMETVFGLPLGGVGVAMNQPETAAYVVRLVETHPADKVLEKEFEVDPLGDYAAAALSQQKEVLRGDEGRASRRGQIEMGHSA